MTPSLPPLEIAGRAERVRRTMGPDALVVTDLTNLAWLTGFTGSAGRAVLCPDALVLVVDGRYGEQLARHGVDADIRVGLTAAALMDHVRAAVAGCATVGFESDHVTVGEHGRLTVALGRDLMATTGVIESARRTKDDGELARLERAAAIASEAFAEVFSLLDAAPTELAFARALDRTMEDRGASGPSFETIVAAGPNAGKPHHRPSDRRIVDGDVLICDFGALFDGYHSDMTRTALLGEVDPWIRDAYDAVLSAQAAGVAEVRAGVTGAQVDEACRSVLRSAGLADYFTHGTGHGTGLQIHEAPWSRQGSTDVLAVRDVVTVEPGVYRGGLGGIRIEDSVVVTTDGCRPLTLTPKDLSCLRSPPTTSRPE